MILLDTVHEFALQLLLTDLDVGHHQTTIPLLLVEASILCTSLRSVEVILARSERYRFLPSGVDKYLTLMRLLLVVCLVGLDRTDFAQRAYIVRRKARYERHFEHFPLGTIISHDFVRTVQQL